MRKIISKEKEEKGKRKKQIAVSVILILVMFLSVLGYSFMGNKDENNEKIVYNGFEFTKASGFWILNKDNF